MQANDLLFVCIFFIHQKSADGGDDFPGLNGAGDDHEYAKDMFGEDRRRPLCAGGEEPVVVWVDAHLEQAGEEQETHAEPCNRLEPIAWRRSRRGGQWA